MGLWGAGGGGEGRGFYCSYTKLCHAESGDYLHSLHDATWPELKHFTTQRKTQKLKIGDNNILVFRSIQLKSPLTFERN